MSSAKSSTRTYAGTPLPQRKEQRRAALIQAGLDLLCEGGIERVTLIGVCRRARLNDRYFKESFRDCDELLVAATDIMIAEGMQMAAAVFGTFDGLDTAGRSSTAIGAAIEFFTDNPHHRALLLASQTSEALRARRTEFVELQVALLSDQARQLFGATAPAEADLRLTGLTLVNGAMEVFTMWLRGDLDVTREHLIEFLAALFTTSAQISTVLESA